MINTINSKQTVQTRKIPLIDKPLILKISEVLPSAIVRQKIIHLAALQERIYKLSQSLPEKLSLLPLSFSKDATKISIYLDEQLFYKDRIDVFLSYYHDRKIGSENGLRVNTNWKLTILAFSDKELQEKLLEYIETNSAKCLYPETSYFFDNQGHYAKIIRIPGALKVNRQTLVDYDKEKDYLSEMTKEDFVLVERALNILIAQFEDYLKWSKLQIIL